jgi:uncharacterized membrane protein
MEHEPDDTPLNAINKTRLEFLVDGVFAIAMTILVLEIRVPELQDHKSASELLTQLAHHGRTFLSYAVSFVMLGIMWHNHHILYRCIRRITHLMYASHIVLLASAALLPFCAALLGRYPANPATFPVYLGCVLLYQLGLTCTWWLAERQNVLDPGLDETDIRTLRKRYRNRAVRLTILFAIYLAYLYVHG